MIAFRKVRDLLADGDATEARRLLSVDDPFANEIESLVFAGDYAEAIRRLDLWLTPKFKSVAQCANAYLDATTCA